MTSQPSIISPSEKLLERLKTFTNEYWSFAIGVKPPPVLLVPWNLETTIPRQLMHVERLAFFCLKTFESCFVHWRHIQTDSLIEFKNLAVKIDPAFKERTLINFEKEDGTAQERMETRHYEYEIEFDHCLINWFNRNYVPCISLVGISPSKP